MPKRSFESVEEFEQHVGQAEELIFDGTENLTQRPQDSEKQRLKFSGKKSTHTDIALVLSDRRTRIYYVSNLYDGHEVDFGVFKQEFAVDRGWFKKFKVLVDLGFVGIEKLYQIKELVIGKKKPRKSKNNPDAALSVEQKAFNKEVSRKRIYVEHAIGKIKKYHILKNRCRLKCQILKNRMIGIAAALWNYQLEINC